MAEGVRRKRPIHALKGPVRCLQCGRSLHLTGDVLPAEDLLETLARWGRWHSSGECVRRADKNDTTIV